MNVHAVPGPKIYLWAAYNYEPEHRDEANLHEFRSEAEVEAFKSGIAYANEDATWWHGSPEGNYFYCVDCGDWFHYDTLDDFDEAHPEDDH